MHKRKHNRVRKAAPNASKRPMEALENRQLMSTVTVTANSDWMSAIKNSNAGDTIKFAAGNYSITGNDANSTHIPGAGRHYVGGSGVSFTSGTSGAKLSVDAGTELSGFTFNSVTLSVEGSGDNIHGNSFIGSSAVTLTSGLSNSSVSHNSFTGSQSFCITGYPGNNDTIDYNYFDLRGITDNQEAIHLTSPCDNLDVSHNVILGTRLRWGIELQEGMTNLTVQYNYITSLTGSNSAGLATGVGSAISCATGGNTAGQNAGENIDISYNTCIASHGSAALEIMGDKGISVHDNYFSGFGTGILNGTGGQANQSLVTTNNTLIVGNAYADGDNTPWSVPARKSNDTIDKIGASGNPAAPSMPTDTGNGSDGTNGAGTSPVTTPVSTTAAPTNFIGTSPSTNEIDLSWTDNSGGKATYVLQRKTTHGSDSYVTIATLGKGVVSYKDLNNVQASWEYDYVITAVQNGVTSNATSVTVQAQIATTPVVGSSGGTTTPTTAVAPTNVNAVGVSSGEVDLVWTDNNGGGATYVIQRKSTRGSDAYVTIATLPAGTTSYKDANNVQANWEYDYLVTAVTGQSTSSAIYAHAQALAVGGVGTSPITVTSPVTTVGGDWTDADLGDSDTSGSSLLAKGTYRVSSGTSDDATGTSHFVYEQTSGNASVVARVTDNSSVSNFGSAGISIRASTDANSASVSLAISSTGDVTLVTSNGSGTASEFDAGAGSIGSRWLKLVRTEGTVTGYYSNDGSTWHRVGSVTLTLPDTLNVGLSVGSQADGTEGVAWFKNVAINSGASVSVRKRSIAKAADVSKKTKAGNGLTAKIYSNAKLKGTALTRIDSDVNFNWGNATPDASVASAPYSVKWTGLVEAPTSDAYTFTVHSDSGVKLWVNHKLMVADWTKTSTGDESGTINLAGGHKYHIKLEYTEPTVQDSAVSLLWSSSTQGLEVIPQNDLFAAAA